MVVLMNMTVVIHILCQEVPYYVGKGFMCSRLRCKGTVSPDVSRHDLSWHDELSLVVLLLTRPSQARRLDNNKFVELTALTSLKKIIKNMRKSSVLPS